MTGELEFSVGEVAAMLGMTPSTIRVWERRYGAVTPWRTAGGRRRYTVDDVAELHRIKSLVASGRRSVKLATLEAQGAGPAPPAVASSSTRSLAPPTAWKAAADALPILVLFLTSAGRIVDANERVIEAFRTSAVELVGRSFTDQIHPHDRAKAVKLYTAPWTERRGWELNLRTVPPRTYAFDSRLVGEPHEALVMLVGRVVECADAGPAELPSRL